MLQIKSGQIKLNIIHIIKIHINIHNDHLINSHKLQITLIIYLFYKNKTIIILKYLIKYL